MSYVLSEQRGGTRHVVLNRADKRNAMNEALLGSLRDALAEAAASEDVDCVVLRGEGPVFSAGIDLAMFAQPLSHAFRNLFLECAGLCETMPKSVVCQIHGACIGGALEVALGCDLRIASDDSHYSLPETRFGVIPDVGGSTRLPAVVGLGRAKEMIMTGRDIDAVEAHRIGLVNRVLNRDELENGTEALVAELAANSRRAVGRAKRILDASARPTLAHGLAMEGLAQELCLKDALRAVGAGPTTLSPGTTPEGAA
jgi:enoyl-CoA hydratase/carnithine racemase